MTKPKILVLGYARHGKDTVAEILRDEYGFSFVSSSLFIAATVLRPALEERGVHYASLEECYADRHGHSEIVGDMRTFWYDTITAYNTPDKSRLSREILEAHDMYVGMRNFEEYVASKHLFDHVVWVDSSARGVPPEQKSSMSISPDSSMYVVANSGTLGHLKDQVEQLVRSQFPQASKSLAA